MQLGAVILAGGASSRMGRSKDALPFGGDTLLGHIVRALRPAAAPIVVVVRDAAQELPPVPGDVVIARDERRGGGPLVAIASGLRRLMAGGTDGGAAVDAAFVCGCDGPFVGAPLASWLAARLGDRALVLPRAGGALQPLVAVYRPTPCLAAISRLAADGAMAPHRLADHVATRVVEEDELRTFDPDLRCLLNVNTPADYDLARALLAP